MISRRVFAVGALALAACLSSAHAAGLAADGSWAEFSVDDFQSNLGGLEWIVGGGDGTALSFSFTIAAGQIGTLTVVDAGFSGDRFTVTDNGSLLGVTSVAVSGDSAGASTVDFDAALSNNDFSRAVFTLGAGSHSITGVLSTSLVGDYGPINATLGGVKLSVSPVPEPASLAMLMAGLGLLTAVLRRRSQSK